MKKNMYLPMINVIKRLLADITSMADHATGSKQSEGYSKLTLKAATILRRLSEIARNELLLEEQDKAKIREADHIILDLEEELEEDGMLGPVHKELDETDNELKKLEDTEIDILRNNRRIGEHVSDALGLVSRLQASDSSAALVLHQLALTLASLLHCLEIDVRKDREVMKHLRHINKAVTVYSGSDSKLLGIWRNRTQQRFVEELLEELK